MLSLTSLTVSSFDVDKLTVAWTFKNTSESLSNYTIDVYRSESPGTGTSEYSLVASGISADTASHNDTTISGIYHPQRTWFYKLKVTNINTSETALLFDSTPAYVKSYTTDRPTLEIIRRKKLATGKLSGIFLIGYALCRITAEFWRVPDQEIGYIAFNWLTISELARAEANSVFMEFCLATSPSFIAAE